MRVQRGNLGVRSSCSQKGHGSTKLCSSSYAGSWQSALSIFSWDQHFQQMWHQHFETKVLQLIFFFFCTYLRTHIYPRYPYNDLDLSKKEAVHWSSDSLNSCKDNTKENVKLSNWEWRKDECSERLSLLSLLMRGRGDFLSVVYVAQKFQKVLLGPN